MAQAQIEKMTLVTIDSAFRDYGMNVLW